MIAAGISNIEFSWFDDKLPNFRAPESERLRGLSVIKD
jgi:hypothetical protein